METVEREHTAVSGKRAIISNICHQHFPRLERVVANKTFFKYVSQSFKKVVRYWLMNMCVFVQGEHVYKSLLHPTIHVVYLSVKLQGLLLVAC